MSDPPLTPDASTLAADLFEQHVDPVAAALARQFPGADPQLISDAAVKAVLDLARDASRYDSRRGSLQAFLRGAARRNLRKRLRSDERRRRCEQEKMIGPVTEGPSAGRSLLEAM